MDDGRIEKRIAFMRNKAEILRRRAHAAATTERVAILSQRADYQLFKVNELRSLQDLADKEKMATSQMQRLCCKAERWSIKAEHRRQKAGKQSNERTRARLLGKAEEADAAAREYRDQAVATRP
mmetsp:Transcript_49911/g.78983  ORF Transcript_49911/g.78983 Transcript_49911/m.78983 type:complete len:124 (-) Transcript_49911:75-446(-)